MEPSLLCSHFLTNALHVTLYQTLFHGDASWTIGTSKFNIGEEMSRLVRESLKHPDLRAAPAAMDKQFPLHSAFERVCGNLQCTICISCAGKTSEFGMRNACYVRNFTSEETLDVEKNNIETILSLENISSRDRPKEISRQLLAGDVERNSLERNSRVWPKNRTSENVSRIILAGSVAKNSLQKATRLWPKDKTRSTVPKHISDEEDSLETVFSSKTTANVRLGGKISRLLTTRHAEENDLETESFEDIANDEVLRDMTTANIKNRSFETKLNFESSAKVIPKNSVSRLLQANFKANSSEKAAKIRSKNRPRGMVSRLIPGDNDVISYYKGEEIAALDRHESFILQAGKTEAARIIPLNNNSAELVLKSLPTRTDLTKITSALLDELSTSGDDVSTSSDDRPSHLHTTVLKLTDLITRNKKQNRVSEIRRITKTARDVSSFSTISDIPLMRAEVRRKKQKQKSTSKDFDLDKTGPRSAKRISNERSKVNFPTCLPLKPTKTMNIQNLKKPLTEQKNPLLISRAKGLAFDGVREPVKTEDEGQSLSIVKQNSVYHVAIKNSENQLGNIFKFKLYGSEPRGKQAECRIPCKDSLSVTVIPTQRGN